MATDYKIISSEYVIDVEASVKKLLSEGYSLHGVMQVTENERHYGSAGSGKTMTSTIYSQAMIKED